MGRRAVGHDCPESTAAGCGGAAAGPRPDLAQKALGAERGGELGLEHLERDRAAVLEVAGEVDRGHAAAAELALERGSDPEGHARARQAVRTSRYRKVGGYPNV